MKRKSRKIRWAAASVEFALVAPILFLIFFASIEFMRANTIRNTAENAAYEGCRAGIIIGGNAADAETAALNILSTVGISGGEVTVTPETLTIVDAEVTVAVSVPYTGNTFGISRFFAGKSIEVSTTMKREDSSF